MESWSKRRKPVLFPKKNETRRYLKTTKTDKKGENNGKKNRGEKEREKKERRKENKKA